MTLSGWFGRLGGRTLHPTDFSQLLLQAQLVE
jgi:hypothetical protein